MFTLRKNNTFLFVNLENLLQFAKTNFQQDTTTKRNYITTKVPILLKKSTSHMVENTSFKSRSFSSNSNMSSSGKKHFSIHDYDIIGFDLDCTLLRYNLQEMVPLEYTCLSNSLQRKGYPSDKLNQPLDLNFLQKGLILDAYKGNVLKFDKNGTILKAFHGDRLLTDEEIHEIYGPERKWAASSEFIKNPLNTWNGPYAEQMRTLLDYFDIPISLVMSRAVTSLNEKERPTEYRVWDDILAGLFEMYKRENFHEGSSEYFEALKNNPDKYLLKTDPKVIEWLKDLKEVQGKATFLLTGSDISFANFTASYALGENWRDLFDSVICFARKPGFFVEDNRPFYRVDLNKMEEGEEIPSSERLKFNTTYSQGCWSSLQNLLKEKSGNTKPKTLYVGDNLIQDVLCPARFAKMDTVAISEEMFVEGVPVKQEVKNTFNSVTSSDIWGSFYKLEESETIWYDIIKKYSKICIPTVDYLVDLKTLDDAHFYPSSPKTK